VGRIALAVRALLFFGEAAVIVDEVLDAGLRKVLPGAQVFVVPWKMSPTRDGVYLDWPIDPLLQKLCPMDREGGFDTTWARRPYAVTIMTPTASLGFPVVLVIWSMRDDPTIPPDDRETTDRWHYLFVVRGAEGIWMPLYAGFSSRHDDRLYGPSLETAAEIENLNVAQRGWLAHFGLRDGWGGGAEANWYRSINTSAAAYAVALFSLLNARNIVPVIEHPSRQVRRARARKHQEPGVSWHVLKLRSLRSLWPSDGASTGEHVAIHWVRGHFKIYTAERPLLGRYSGRFFWQPHLAGKDTARRIEKTYVVPAN
jgi:hypothetical protein